MRKFYGIVSLAVALWLLAACNPQTYKQINYIQDVQRDTLRSMGVNQGIVIQPQDQLSIVVSSRTPELAVQFNLPTVSYQAGSEVFSGSGANMRLMGYVVNNDGDINFPVLGLLHVAGMTRWELQELIHGEIVSGVYIKDPIVTVEFMNFKISVLGEVTSPGTYSISGDKITIFQALALARDLTIYGKRDGVEVIREQNGQRKVYVLDLRDSDIFKSPAYYLQQNDVVYVVPNSVRAGQSTINENYFKSASFWMSLASVGVTVTNFVVTMVQLGIRNSEKRNASGE